MFKGPLAGCQCAGSEKLHPLIDQSGLLGFLQPRVLQKNCPTLIRCASQKSKLHRLVYSAGLGGQTGRLSVLLGSLECIGELHTSCSLDNRRRGFPFQIQLRLKKNLVFAIHTATGQVLDLEEGITRQVCIGQEAPETKLRKGRRKSTTERDGGFEANGIEEEVSKTRPARRRYAGARKEVEGSGEDEALSTGDEGPSDDEGIEKNGGAAVLEGKPAIGSSWKAGSVLPMDAQGESGSAKSGHRREGAGREGQTKWVRGGNSGGSTRGMKQEGDDEVGEEGEEDRKVKAYVEALLGSESEEEVDALLQAAKVQLGSGRRAWTSALRRLLMAEQWKPTMEAKQGSPPEAAWGSNQQRRLQEERGNRAVVRALKAGNAAQARRLVEDMVSKGYAPSRFVTSQVMACLGRLRKADEVESLFQFLVKEGCALDTVIHNCVVAAYGEAGKFEEMEATVERMRQMDCPPDVVTYNTLIRKYLLGGQVEQALEVLQVMRRDGNAPNARSYNTVLGTLCESGELEAAHELMHEMAEEGCRPSLVSYNILLKGYARAQRLEDMEKCFQEVVEAGFLPNNITFGQCMTAYRDASMLEKVEEYFHLMPKYRCVPDVMTLSVLASAYGKASRLDERQELYDHLDIIGYRYDQKTKRWVLKCSSPTYKS